MAKRSNSKNVSVSKVGIAIESTQDYNTIEQSIVVRSRFPAIIKITGRVSGQPYIWMKSGEEVRVDARDWPVLKELRMGSAFCCFGDNANYLFELVD